MEVQQQEKQVENNQQNIKDIETTAPGKLRVIKRIQIQVSKFLSLIGLWRLLIFF